MPSQIPSTLRDELGAYDAMDVLAIVPEHAQRIIEARGGQAPRSPSQLVSPGGIAVIGLSGPLSKTGGWGGQSTVAVRGLIRQAAADESVKGIALLVDSPGGNAAGTRELAAEVAAAAAKKPTHAFIEDLGASAAYWVASQAGQVFANSTAMVGSIGTYAVIYDYSGTAGQMGLKVHVVKAGEFKGAGVQGTDVTEKQLGDWQRLVNGLNDHFVAGVAQGRSMSPERARALADGRLYMAADAKGLGLIDDVRTFDEVVSHLESLTAGQPGKRTAMSTATEAIEAAAGTLVSGPRPATIQELRGCCKGASSDFLVKQLEANATLDQAKDAYIAQLHEDKEKAEQAAAAAKAAGGTKALGTVNSAAAAPEAAAGSNPIEDWRSALAAKVQAGVPEKVAIRQLATEQPDLHTAWLAALPKPPKPRR